MRLYLLLYYMHLCRRSVIDRLAVGGFIYNLIVALTFWYIAQYLHRSNQVDNKLTATARCDAYNMDTKILEVQLGSQIWGYTPCAR